MLPDKGGVRLAEAAPECGSASKYEPGDILLSNIRPYFRKIWYADREGSCSNDVLVIKAKEIINSKFLYYVLSDNAFFDYDTLTSKGTKMPRGTKEAIMRYSIPAIPLPVQRRVAGILSGYDSLIENNAKRIKLLEQMAENLYKEWFVRFRFPGHENVPMENGLPKGWKKKRLFDVASVSYGYAFKSHLFCEESNLNAVVRIRDIPNNSTKTFTSETCDEKYLIEKNALLIGMDGIFHTCLWNGDRAYLNQRVVKLNSKDKNLCNYLLYLSILPQVNFWEQTISGTTVAHLGDKHLKKMTVLFPTTEVLKTANGIIAQIMVEKNTLFKQNENLVRQRDLLLPRLMSGRLEVEAEGQPQ